MKVEIFRSGGKWRHGRGEPDENGHLGEDAELSPDEFGTPGAAYEAAGGQSLESVEIVYPEDEKVSALEALVPEPDPVEAPVEGDEGGEV